MRRAEEEKGKKGFFLLKNSLKMKSDKMMETGSTQQKKGTDGLSSPTLCISK